MNQNVKQQQKNWNDETIYWSRNIKNGKTDNQAGKNKIEIVVTILHFWNIL